MKCIVLWISHRVPVHHTRTHNTQSDMFQDDVFPPCPSGKPALTAEEWASGVDKDPLLVAFTKGGLVELSAEESKKVGREDYCKMVHEQVSRLTGCPHFKGLD